MIPRKHIIVQLVLATAVVVGKDRPDERLQSVTAVFVSGNNQAAESARQTLKSGKTCLTLAIKAADADATLDMNADSQSQGGGVGSVGGRAWIASATLTLKTGDLIWSRSERFSDAPFMSGGKTAGNLVVRHLAEDASCKSRKPRR